MTKEPEEYVGEVKICKCGSSNVQFKYKNNKSAKQPRYMCLDCKSLFTSTYHNRPKPEHYNKTRGVDPEELQHLDRQCSKCGDHNALFKYYNNQKKVGKAQPRFQCLSCGEYFSMRFDGKALIPSKQRNTARQSAQAPALPSPRIVDDPDMSSGAYESKDQYYVDGGQCSYTGQMNASVPQEQYYNGGQCSYSTGAQMEMVVPREQVCYNGGQCSYTGQMEASAPMEQCYDGGQCSYIGQMEVTAATMIPNDNAGSASEHYVTENGGQEGQFYTTDNQVYYQVPSFQMDEQSDVDKFASIYEYNHVMNTEQGVQSSDTAVWGHQGDCGQCSDYFEGVAAGSEVIPVDQWNGGQPFFTEAQVEATPTMDPSYMISSDDAVISANSMMDWEQVGHEPLITDDQGSALAALKEESDVGNNSSAYEYEVVQVEQGDQFSRADIVQEAQCDVGQGFCSEDIEAPTILSDDGASTYEVVSAHQEVDQVSNSDAVLVEQSDGSQCPFSLFLSRLLPGDVSCSE